MRIYGYDVIDLNEEKVLEMATGLMSAVWRGAKEVYVGYHGEVYYFEDEGKDNITGWEWHKGTWVKLVRCKHCGDYVLPDYINMDGVCKECRGGNNEED